MSFISNARRALGGKPENEYYDYDNYDEENYDGYDEVEEKPHKRGFFSFLSKKNDYDDEIYDDEPVSQSDRRSDYETRERDRSSRRYSSYSSSSYSDDRRSSGNSIRYDSSNMNANIEVKVLYPQSFDDSADIVKEVKAHKITIFDVSEIDSNDEARRIVDYICGAAEGMECPFSRLCPSIFCIAPKGVKLTNSRSKYRR